ncbi:MAG: Gfo/Idh/MocA family oxidoreductase [Kiritimatiellae bacterium]|nr:Gfo/Idh/MocA family oxidoreductase [Kiritimatiellia bacterium]
MNSHRHSSHGTRRAAAERVSRRSFLQRSAVGAGLAMISRVAANAQTSAAPAATPQPAPAVLRGAGEVVRVGLVGCGAQGRVLLEACMPIPDLQFVAVCDIWPYNLRYGVNYLQKFGHTVSSHEDFDEFLSAGKDKGMQAVIIATPDIWHSPYTVAALKAGLHVYCEKMMSNTVEGARAMVRAMRETGRLLQIGHQRRSNPRYLHALEKIMRSGMLGRVVNAGGQWNRSIRGSVDLTWPERYALPQATLEKYGYANMREFRNWRWFRKYSGGPISDLGAHQIDIFGWFLGARPKTVMASGGTDYFTDREWYDNVMAIYEYGLPDGSTTRVFYQVLTTTSAGGGYFETFMGVDGTLKISENEAITRAYKEAHADWTEWIEKGAVRPIERAETIPVSLSQVALLDVRASADLDAFELPVPMDKKAHQPHLENFFDAVRGKAKLNCPGDEAFHSEAAVFKVNPAVEAKRQLVFEPSDFEV